MFRAFSERISSIHFWLPWTYISFHYLYVDELAHVVENPFWDRQAAVTQVSVNLTKLLLQLIDIGSRFEFKIYTSAGNRILL